MPDGPRCIRLHFVSVATMQVSLKTAYCPSGLMAKLIHFSAMSLFLVPFTTIHWSIHPEVPGSGMHSATGIPCFLRSRVIIGQEIEATTSLFAIRFVSSPAVDQNALICGLH